MEKQFEKFLLDEGFSEITPSGNNSTVYDYSKRVAKVCHNEGYPSLRQFAKDIDIILPKYREGGEKEDIGKQSSKAVISALEQFKLFVSGERNTKNRRKKLSKEVIDMQKQSSKTSLKVNKTKDKTEILQPRTEKQRGFELKIFGITVIKWSVKEF